MFWVWGFKPKSDLGYYFEGGFQKLYQSFYLPTNDLRNIFFIIIIGFFKNPSKKKFIKINIYLDKA